MVNFEQGKKVHMAKGKVIIMIRIRIVAKTNTAIS